MAKDITFKRLVSYWPLYFFVLPSALLVATFSYFPAASAMYHSAFRWNGDYINLYVGSANFVKALGTPTYWILTLIVTMVMIYNSQKKTVFAAVMKIACGVGMPVVILLWLSRFDLPGPVTLKTAVNPLIGWGGVLALLAWRVDRDSEHRGVILFLVSLLGISSVLRAAGLPGINAWAISTLVVGLALWVLPSRKHPPQFLTGMRISQALVGVGIMVWMLALHAGGEAALWSGFSIIAILVVANLVKMVPSIATAVVIHRLKSDKANYWYRVLFVVPMIIPGMVGLLIWKFFFQSDGLFNLVLKETGLMHLLYLIDAWTHNGIFLDAAAVEKGMSISQIFEAASHASPAWLGSPELVLPAFIIWGFPWVGVVGVLIYLAGLQSIDEAVYEAADLDGVGPLGKFLAIELPLILTQVRINLVLMIIGTLQMYGNILILFGDGGGPNGKMMVPGLLMFRSAFVEGYAGYACSIGLILFFLILVLSEINNRFVRVEK